jgi:hypothetical protein
MTTTARIPTLEEIMNGNNPYELVDTPFATEKMEAWRAQSIATGASGALAAFHRLYEMVRNDAADAAARADEAIRSLVRSSGRNAGTHQPIG